MAATFRLQVLTPSRKFFDEDVEMVVVKTTDGEIGVMKGHAPLVVAIATGPMRIQVGGEWKEAALTEGFMEITQEKAVMLVDTAEWPDEIDVERAKAAKERAQERLTRQISRQEHARSQAAMARALARLKVTKNM